MSLTKEDLQCQEEMKDKEKREFFADIICDTIERYAYLFPEAFDPDYEEDED